MENEGIKKDDTVWSQEDRKVIELWDRECKLINGHYVIPIPWRNKEELVPNNISVAMYRLKSLNKILIKRGLRDRYNEEIMKLVQDGYAEKIPLDEIQNLGRIWYLPHHAVVTEKKPDKVRIVFDCASKYQGKSLNDRCLQGPDFNNKLLYVILRFRQHEYAIMADIESMYHQVKVSKEDKDALRFLWYDDSENIIQYRMTSHLFGGVWCASSSIYGMRKTIEDNPRFHEMVKGTIRESFYVDDCLKSVENKEDGEVIIQGTQELLQTGGFRLTKFVVNDEELMKMVPEKDRAKEVKDISSHSNSKALGIRWNVKSDEFYFKVNQRIDDQVTRRNMISMICSIFDPLGLASPFVVKGKMIFQEATRLGLSWDEEPPVGIVQRWKSWERTLVDLCLIKVPRCIKPKEFNDATVELHHFSDASEKAYGCCTYVRCLNKQGKIQTTLLMSKNKVAPIKMVTIPRLELQAAVLSAKIDYTLRRELELSLNRSYFWVDSELVLKYIKNKNRRFQVYVGNRVATIRQLTEPAQ